MSKLTYVIVPFGLGTYRFNLTKARLWGPIEKLLLEYLSNNPSSSDFLAEISSLPRQLIVEMIIPLMQVGWVEIKLIDNSYVFTTTIRGSEVAEYDELPSENIPYSRVRSFLVDPLTNSCYRYDKRKKKQAFQLYSRAKIIDATKDIRGICSELNIISNYVTTLPEIFETIVNFDEEVSGIADDYIDTNYSRYIKYALAEIDENGNVTGVPDVSDELMNQILKRDKLIRQRASALDTTKSDFLVGEKITPPIKQSPIRYVNEDNIKVLVGPNSHKEHFEFIINNAKTRILIHSTFINENNIDMIFESLLDAAQRSVQVDILWGQTEPEETNKIERYRKVIDKFNMLNSIISQKGLNTQIRFHPSPTQSHAKFLIFDLMPGVFSATIGSCNWLSSGFNRFEVSACINDTLIVSDLLDIASHLSMLESGLSNNLSRELAVISARLARANSLEESSLSSKHKRVQLVSAHEHHSIAKYASDTAKNNIFICSHRVSYAGDRPILLPLKTAKKHNCDLKIEIVYGRSSGGMKGGELKTLKEELESLNFDVISADNPQVHAKVISWDQDFIVISSLNWLSASSRGDIYSELGILINLENVYEKVMVEFNKMYN